MSLRNKMISGGVLVGLSQVANMALSFGRNIIIARAISLADMGIAATIALALAIVESASEMNVNQLLVQSKDGGDPKLQATAHSFTAMRGVITALILAISGGPLARLFGVPQAAWAFQLMAIAPLIRGFAHQDVWRYHRDLRFGPLVKIELISQIVSLLATWPLAARLGDYSVMLWVILIQVSVVTILSHLYRDRLYQFGFDRTYIFQIIRFGWPLLVNGILILLLNYGDRVVIAAFPKYSMADVGLYMVASSVVLMPTLLICKLAATILLPTLAKVQDDRQVFDSQFRKITAVVGIAAVLQTVLLIIAGPSLVVLCFGEKYLPVAAFFGWLAAACGIRVLRLSPTIGALALGDSTNTLIANIARCSGFIVAIVASIQGAGLVWFAIAAFVGELISFVAASFSLNYRQSVYDSTSFVMTGLLLAMIALSMGVFEAVCGPDVIWIIPTAVALIAGLIAVLLATWLLEPVRGELRKVFSGLGLVPTRFRS